MDCTGRPIADDLTAKDAKDAKTRDLWIKRNNRWGSSPRGGFFVNWNAAPIKPGDERMVNGL